MEDEASEAVRRQYEAYSYPSPLDDVSKDRLAADPSAAGVQIWPCGKPREDLRILSAGCGTHQAAMLAFHNRSCSVLGIDLSGASLSHQERLREKHTLSNLELKQMSLLDVGTLYQSFDYIVCTGVLHHLSDPDAGLRALASVLAPGGRMYLMLYARAARAGVYLLQEAFRLMQIRQTSDDIALARSALQFAPKDHHVASYGRKSHGEMRSDAAFVDSFLHPQDRAFSIAEIMEFLDRAHLSFAGWQDNGKYYPDWFVSGDVLKRIRSLPLLDQWTVIDNLTLFNIKHDFLVCRAEDSMQTIRFDDNDWPTFIPSLRKELSTTGNAEEGWKIFHGEITTPLTRPEAFLFSQIDSTRSIADILATPALARNPPEDRTQFGLQFFSRMWRLGHVFYSRAPAAN